MEPNFKEALDKSLEELKSIQDKVDEFIDDFPDDTHDIKATAKRALGQVNSLLNKAVEQAGVQAEEAQLQAHLGLKEAQEKLESSRVVVDDYMARTGEVSKKLLDEVELKQHLAMMEAKDFWEQRGSKMAEEFKESAVDMQAVAEQAMEGFQEAMGKWSDIFNELSKDASGNKNKD